MLPELTALFPITVICAICLFAIKEGLEYRRRRQADARKRSGIIQLLDRECLENIHALDRLEHLCKDIKQSEQLKESDKIDFDCIHKVRFNRTSSVWYECTYPDGKLHSQSAIPAVTRDALNKHMMDAASLGDALFNSMQNLQTISADLEHMRSSLVNYLDDDEQLFLEMFCGYGISHLPEIRLKLIASYKDITGKDPIITPLFQPARDVPATPV
ncbi:MAG: hypothetical protein AB1631_26690 [Acidobacteriota bacterium]